MISKNQIKYLHSLRLGKFRDSNRAFIAEGVKLIDDLVISHFNIHIIYGAPAWIDSHQRLIASQEYVIQEVEEEDMNLKSISTNQQRVKSTLESPGNPARARLAPQAAPDRAD